jgi:hypothetical protein
MQADDPGLSALEPRGGLDGDRRPRQQDIPRQALTDSPVGPVVVHHTGRSPAGIGRHEPEPSADVADPLS